MAIIQVPKSESLGDVDEAVRHETDIALGQVALFFDDPSHRQGIWVINAENYDNPAWQGVFEAIYHKLGVPPPVPEARPKPWSAIGQRGEYGSYHVWTSGDKVKRHTDGTLTGYRIIDSVVERPTGELIRSLNLDGAGYVRMNDSN